MTVDRVPMKNATPMFAKDDVAAAIKHTPRVGVRFSLDVNEEALASMGREAMPFIVQKLAGHDPPRTAHD
jgi:hypothetical protein